MPSQLLLGCLGGLALLAGVTACGAGNDQSGAPPPPAPTTSAAAPSAVNPTVETAAVESTWTEWTAAVAADDSAKRAELVAAKTLEYYDRLRTLALTASEISLRGESLKDQFTVYELRAGRVPLEVLRNAQGRELYRQLLDTSVVVDTSAAYVAAREVKATEVQLLPSGNSAFARLVGAGGTSEFKVRFEREDGRWRLDLTPLLTIQAERFRLEALAAADAEHEFLDATLLKVYGPDLAQQVRQPIDS